MSEFANEPALELRRAPVREALLGALAQLEPELPLRVPLLIGGESRHGDELVSADPGAPDDVVAVAASASAQEVDAAVRVADGARAWAAAAQSERSARLVAAAAIMRERRLRLAAIMVRECAKPWAEADGDVCEAIDFLEYYARTALEIHARGALRQLPGERNTLRYGARGVVAAISPWNFPLAIPTGMVAAPLALGNAVVLKPAEQSPAIAHELVRALREGGVPPEAIGLLPGDGDVGAALVRHRLVRTIVFTGSSAVGLEINRAAAETADGQAHIKSVVAEMGGKNCVIVDADADLDEAVPAIVYSAYGYAGQKCSAASRVLVHEAVAEALLARLAGAVRELRVGAAADFATDVPPVITREAQQRIRRYGDLAARDGELVATSAEPSDDGWYCAPLLARGLEPASPVLREEIFGPVLHVEPVADVAAACAIVDELPFGLTAGLFSRNPAVIEAVSRTLPVGNLYVNRQITGAMVSRQPFGGNRLSGTGSKPGGADYLLQFAEPHVVTENTMRHGLAL